VELEVPERKEVREENEGGGRERNRTTWPRETTNNKGPPSWGID